ncbi:MAG: hypothetical protein P4L99_10095 [Chthoniobacter sp.]|nr:hypothetical protein [Chthoniobacter sp.]
MKLRPFLPRTTLLATGMVALAFLSRDVCAADSPPPEISFTTHTLKEENVEGPDVARTYITAGAKRIVVGAPKDCRLTTDGGGMLILLADAGLDGEIHVRRSPFTPELDLAQNALQYRDAASQANPKDATNLEVLPPVMNPYPYNGWKSLGFTFTYSAYGRSTVRTVSYINLEFGAQIVVTTLSTKRDAEKVEKIARQFMSSWWVMGDGAKR